MFPEIKINSKKICFTKEKMKKCKKKKTIKLQTIDLTKSKDILILINHLKILIALLYINSFTNLVFVSVD